MNAGPLIAQTIFPALARALVVAPEELHIDIVHGSGSSTVAATPPKSDAGNLIGKNGRTVKAFEMISKLVGEKHQWPIIYRVQVPPVAHNPTPVFREPIMYGGATDFIATAALLRSTLNSFLSYPVEVTFRLFEFHVGFEAVLNSDEPLPVARLTYGAPRVVLVGQKPVDLPNVLTGDDAVSGAMNVIFAAIMRLHGLTTAVTLVRQEPSQEQQPASADGRYAGEKR
jgi:predicted RNA-binding protein YlqC (UPF0109 family)